MNVIEWVWAAFKGLTMQWTGRTAWGPLALGSTRYDWAATIGDGRTNAAVAACVKWLQRTFPEAPMRVLERDRAGDLTPNPAHPLAQLLERPNPHYSGLHLWAATIADFSVTGNAYWLKVRSGRGRVVEVWWVPSSMIEPRWPDDGSAFISHYDYMVDATITRLDPADVVHFRDGFDPNNIRKGLSPLGTLAREIATDNEAANWAASLLRNMAVPGVVIAPDKDSAITAEDADAIKTGFAQRFGGDRRGEPLVLGAGVTVRTLAWSPEQMHFREIRRIPEERITAAFGVPAIVVGLGAGLDRSTFANMSEAREAAYESCLIPLQRLLASEIQHQLVGDFGDTVRLRVDFDLSKVRVLQADMNALANRVDVLVRAGVLTINEARQEVGADPLDGGDVLLLPGAWAPTPPSHLAALMAAPPPDPTQRALPPPSPLRALPSAAARSADDVATKAADDIPDGLDRLRQDREPAWQAEVAAFLAQQADRIASRLAETRDAGALVPEAETEALTEVLTTLQRGLLGDVQSLVAAELAVSFELDDPATREYLRTAGVNITAISDQTRDLVRAALVEGQEAGEGIDQLARRIRDLEGFSPARARVVARTELGTSQNAAALSCYRASGVVVGVRVLDGTGDEVCGAINGRTFPLDKTPPLLGHPNCVRALSPVLDTADLAGAA